MNEVSKIHLPSGPKRLKPIEFLLVDDNDDDVLFAQKALKSCKTYNSLSIVGDGLDALHFLRQENEFRSAPRPDLILLDLNMPRMDGRETLEEIKRDPLLNTIPIVVLTSSLAEQDILRSYDLEASCFITKPIDAEQIDRVVQSLHKFLQASCKIPNTIE